MDNKMTINCVCGHTFEMPMVVGDNGEFTDFGRLSFTGICPKCNRYSVVHFVENEIQFFPSD